MKKLMTILVCTVLVLCVTGLVFAADSGIVYDQLMEAETLGDFRGILLDESNRAEVSALEYEEIMTLSARVEYLYGCISEPTADDTDIRDEMVETLSILPNGPETLYGDPTAFVDFSEIVSSDQEIKVDTICYLTESIVLSKRVLVSNGATLTIINETGKDLTISRDSKFNNNNLFFVNDDSNSNGATLVLKGTADGRIIIDGNSVAVQEAAVSVYGNIVCEYVTFQNNINGSTNKANQYQGGAVSLRSNYHSRASSFTNCIFVNNQSSDGGAVCTTRTNYYNVTFTNCEFTNNKAQSLTLADGTVTGGYGGAIATLKSTNATINIAGCTFTGNSAEHGGGAVYINTTSQPVTISNTTIDGCKAPLGDAVMLAAGTSSAVKMDGVTVKNCTDYGSGGGYHGTIYAASGSSSTLTMSGCTVSGNSKTYGGGVYWHSSGKLTASGCEFTNNSAKRYWDASTSKYTGGVGGAIYLLAPAEIKNCTFSGNSAEDGGGAIDITASGCTIDIVDSTISECKSGNGAAIRLSSSNTAKVNMTRVLVEKCDGTGYSGDGGVIRTTGIGKYQLTIDQCVFRENSHSRGAAVYWNANGDGASLTISDSQFLNNTVTYQGGALYIEATCTISGTSGTTTEAITSGGIPETGIVGTLFQGNTAGTKGGAICIAAFNAQNSNTLFDSTENEVSITGNVTVYRNHANVGGGVAYDIGNSHKFNDDFVFNLVSDGAVFSYNTATKLGGGIFVEYDPNGDRSANGREKGKDLGYIARVTINSGEISNNEAPVGGGIYVGKGQCIINGGTLKDNTATSGNGGAAYVTNSPTTDAVITEEQNNTKFIITGGNISGNSATQNGGAVAVSDGTVTVSGGILDGNSASQNGGAVYVDGGDYIMTSGTLSNNEAENMGGGLAVDSGSVVIGVENCPGDDSGHTGGDLGTYCPVLVDNTAVKDGGGIAVTGGTTTMYCGNLESNSCTENQASNSYFQQQTSGDSVFNFYGGSLDVGVNVESGSFNDYRDADGSYKVTYHAVYDDVNAYTEERVAGSFLTLPSEEALNNSNFIRSGKILLGWSAKDGADTGFLAVGSTLTLTGDTDLYAVWKDSAYRITYVLGNSSVSGNPDSYTVSVVSSVITLNQPVPTDGTKFMGWKLTENDGNWTDADINGAQLLAGGKYGDIELTAQWANVAHSVTYVFGCDDYTDPGNPLGFNSGDLSDGGIILKAPTRPGYTFMGWALDSVNGEIITEISEYKDYALYATWNLNTYTVTFNTGYSGGTNPDSVTYDVTSAITLPTLTRPGYEFIEWRATTISSDGNWQSGEKYTAGTTGKYGNVTLTAQWKRSVVDLTVSFSGTGAEQSVLIQITGTPDNGEEFPGLTFAMVADSAGTGTLTVSQLPVGKYTVVVLDDWSWRYGNSSVQLNEDHQITVSTDNNVQFVFEKDPDKSQWLNDYDAG